MLFLSLALAGTTPVTTTSCVDPCAADVAQAKLDIVQHAKTPEEALKATLKPQTRIVFFGESHNNLKSTAMYPEIAKLIQKLSPSRLNCIFIEQSFEFSPLLEDVTAGKIEYSEALKRMHAMFVAQGVMPPATPDEVEQMIKDRSEETNLNSRFFQFARDNRIQVSSVDWPIQKFKGLFDGTQSVEDVRFERNEFMAKELERQMKARKCDLAIMVNGSAHLDKKIASTSGSPQTVREHAEALGLPSVSIRFDYEHPFDFASPLGATGAVKCENELKAVAPSSPFALTFPGDARPIPFLRSSQNKKQEPIRMNTYDIWLYRGVSKP
jgi:hypothetical protein